MPDEDGSFEDADPIVVMEGGEIIKTDIHEFVATDAEHWGKQADVNGPTAAPRAEGD